MRLLFLKIILHFVLKKKVETFSAELADVIHYVCGFNLQTEQSFYRFYFEYRKGQLPTDLKLVSPSNFRAGVM